MIKYILLLILFASCSLKEEKKEDIKLTVNTDSLRLDSIQRSEALARLEPVINDSLNTIAQTIAGNADSNSLFNSVAKNKHYINFSSSFSKRWTDFDTSRILKLTHFRTKELAGKIKGEKILFYPFSGPDILYATIFFPEAEKYILIGLEPVGSLPDFKKAYDDSLQKYYSKLNSSLHAILKFSFFRTESMGKDLRNTEVDGTIHLLFLFLSRTGNSLVSAKPVTVDSLGNKEYLESFSALKSSKLKTRGVEICFKTPDNKVKELTYFSLNLSDAGLKNNKGFGSFLGQMKDFNTYLKGASYLLHKPYFSVVRNTILKGASTIVQDDSGISLKYFKESNENWDYKLYGEYTKPISLFKNAYQKDLDSLYKSKGATPLGFGIGYNFKDKNSNLLIATRN
jgi:hypothetical protein